MMRSKARPAARARRFGMRIACLATATLALAVGPVTISAPASADVNQEFYTWCVHNLSTGQDYCCAHAGGVIRDGQCVNPAG